MALRAILLIIGVIIIVGIAIDAIRRKRPGRAHRSDAVEPIINNGEQRDPPSHFLLRRDGGADEGTEILEDNFICEPKVSPLLKSDDPSQITISSIDAPISANEIHLEKPIAAPEPIKSANEVLPENSREQKPKTMGNPRVMTLTVMSIDQKPFAGYDLVKALDECSLFHGEMSIYHRHKYRNGKGPLYFSVASVINPGTIDPTKLGNLSTPGLALFMELNNPKHDRITFKQMLVTAQELAEKLGGVVCDAEKLNL
jgi:cell division protein ZipA